MSKMKYFEVEILDAIVSKLGKSKDVMHRIKFAKRINVVKDVMKAYNFAKEAPEEVKEYQRLRNEILGKYAVVTGEKDGRVDLVVTDRDGLQNASQELNEKYKSTLELESKRVRDLEKLADTVVDVDMEPVEDAWCGDLIDGNDAAFLLRFGFLVSKDDDSSKSE